jgi:hypothetical protein
MVWSAVAGRCLQAVRRRGVLYATRNPRALHPNPNTRNPHTAHRILRRSGGCSSSCGRDCFDVAGAPAFKIPWRFYQCVQRVVYYGPSIAKVGAEACTHARTRKHRHAPRRNGIAHTCTHKHKDARTHALARAQTHTLRHAELCLRTGRTMHHGSALRTALQATRTRQHAARNRKCATCNRQHATKYVCSGCTRPHSRPAGARGRGAARCAARRAPNPRARTHEREDLRMHMCGLETSACGSGRGGRGVRCSVHQHPLTAPHCPAAVAVPCRARRGRNQ